MQDLEYTTIILGSGFSKCGNLPITAEISDDLLDESFRDKLDKSITCAIKKFLEETFNWNMGEEIPTLEDIFTIIDLSLKSNHYLGRKYKPKKLLAFRRLLIYRIFEILNRDYQSSDAIDDFLKDNSDENFSKTDFIVLNWDIVLENSLKRLFPDLGINYQIQANRWDDRPSENSESGVKISKIHGSSNWVYCRNCHMVWYELGEKLSLSLQAGLGKADIRLFDESFTKQLYRREMNYSSEKRNCKNCGAVLSQHIATFSFRKALNTHAFDSSWLHAEESLSKAAKWIFVGYSLPAADYEFKHLLKNCQKKYSDGSTSPKDIEVVLKEDKEAEKRYKQFFGSEQVKIFQHGLQNYV